MRKIMLSFLACLLALTAAADDRTLTAGEYWIDNNHNQRTTVDIGSDGLMQFVLDASTLSEGLHTLHYRAQDSEGSYSPAQAWLFYRIKATETGTQTLDYWVDEGNHETRAVADGQAAFVLDASSLSEGLHLLHYRILSGVANSPAQTWLFYRYVPSMTGASTLEYWLDENGEHQTLAAGSEENTFVVDASALDEGLHTLHYRLNTLSGQTGAERTWLFYRVAPAYESGIRTLEYWVDEGQHETRTLTENDVAFTLDASALGEGLHTLNYQLREEGGRVSPQQQWLFYRTSPKPAGISLSYYRIWWNDHQDKAVDIQLADGTVEYLYEETLAVPDYARNDGFSRNNTATFHIVFCDDQGNFSPIESAVVGYPDIYPPVTTLSASKNADGIALSWKSSENTVRDWNVYYSENGEPYLLWKANTTEQSATFRGQQGVSYKFIVTARDKDGNYEAVEESKAVKVTLNR